MTTGAPSVRDALNERGQESALGPHLAGLLTPPMAYREGLVLYCVHAGQSFVFTNGADLGVKLQPIPVGMRIGDDREDLHATAVPPAITADIIALAADQRSGQGSHAPARSRTRQAAQTQNSSKSAHTAGSEAT